MRWGCAMSDLEPFRRRLDALDEEITRLLGERFDVCREIALHKGKHGIAMMQPERVAEVRARYRARGSAGGRQSAEQLLSECYAELEIAAGASDQEVTKAYRRQMSRHHPDKLVANGLPESMAQWAKQKTQRVQEAYEATRAARGMR